MDIVIVVLIALILIVLTDHDDFGTPMRQRQSENGAGAPQGAVLNFA